MIERFRTTRGETMLIDEMRRQKLAVGVDGLAEALAKTGTLSEVRAGESVIQQGDKGADVYFIVAGSFDIIINGIRVARRHAGDHVGEMAAVSPVQSRSATVVAAEDAVLLKISEDDFATLADQFKDIWQRLARELAGRLLQRNALLRKPNEKVRVFVISSVESLNVARQLQSTFAHDPFLTVVWSDGVFKVSNYTLESLEKQLDQSDFAVAIAHADDQSLIRGTEWPTPRDNVVFELGYFMGRLGRERAILMEPRETKVKLPSDLAGVTTIGYRFGGADSAALFAPACHELREHIMALGRRT